MSQGWLLLQGSVEHLYPVGAELLAGQVVDFQNSAQQGALAQGLVGVFVVRASKVSTICSISTPGVISATRSPLG